MPFLRWSGRVAPCLASCWVARERERVWTGSCPCQPFSSAGKGLAEKDDRHLWPEFRRLIVECRPATVFGEQVASKLGREWLAGVRADLEALGYGVGAADLCAAGGGAPHVRQRLFWVADANPARWTRATERQIGQEARQSMSSARGEAKWLGDANSARSQRWSRTACADQCTDWTPSVVIRRRDGKACRISSQPGDEPLAHGIPSRTSDPRMGYLLARLAELGHDTKAARRILKEARRNRVGRLRGYGNAIVPQIAAEFIISYLEALNETYTPGLVR